MNKIRLTILASLLLVLPLSTLQAQKWLEMWKDSDGHSFLEIQKEANEYFETHDTGRGSYYKQFKRWEYYMEPRSGKDGTIMNPQSKAFNNYMEYLHAKSFANETQKTASVDGDWTFFGSEDHFKGTSGYNGGIGRINVVAFHPSVPSTIYVGAPAGGLWRTNNTGATWTPLTDGISFWGVSGIVVHPSTPNTIFILTGDGDGGSSRSAGVWKTTNGGTTWSPTGLSINSATSSVDGYKLLMDPSNSNIMYAVMTNGLHKTIDGGVSWSIVKAGSYRDMEFKPGVSNTIYLTGGNAIHRSTNAGATWTIVHTVAGASRIALGVSPANGNYVYALAGPANGTGAFRGLFRSTNSGTTWTTRTTTPNILGYSPTGSDNKSQSNYDLALAVSPTDINRLHTGGVSVWLSTNGGITFTAQSEWHEGNPAYQYTHADIHELVYNGNVLYCGSDGGVYRKASTLVPWSDISSGLAITEFYRFSGTPQNANLYVGGAQDNGCNKIEGPIPDLQMEHIFGADGMETAIDPTNVNTVFIASQGGGMRRSTNGGNTFSYIKPSNLGGGAWVTPYVLDPNNSNRILAGFTDVGISPSQGVPTSSWVNLSNGAIGGSRCVALAFAPSNSNVIYVVKSFAIYKSVNGGTTWSNITAGLPGGAYSYVAVSPTDPNRVYITRSGWIANSKVFMSTNGGTTWTNYSGTGLPNVPANCIVYEAGSDNGVYVGTDAGVYYRDDNQTDWVDFSNGLPYCRVMEMEINPLANRLRAATFGRSIWESDLFGTPCPDDLVLAGPLSGTQRIEANNTITSTNTINAGADITFSAGVSITLNPGFNTVLGSVFNAVMDGCTSMKNDASPVSGTYEPPLTPQEAGPVAQIKGYEITNYPNPFRDRTWISYRLPNDAPVMIEVFNMAAQRLAVLVDQKDVKAGMHTIPFNASELPAGQYFVRFTSGNHMSYHQLSRMR